MSAAKVATKKKKKKNGKKSAKLEANEMPFATVALGEETAHVGALMSSQIETCAPHDNLATAASALWRGDCGCLPVLDEHLRPCGWITDRDIGMAVGLQPARASEIQVAGVMSSPVLCCREDDPVSEAMTVMAEHQVRRLAVVDEDGLLTGVLSVADLVRSAQARASAEAPSVPAVFETLRAIGGPHGGGQRFESAPERKTPKAARIIAKREKPTK